MEEDLLKLEKENNRKKAIIAILLFVLVLSCLIVFIFFCDKKENNKTNQNNQQKETGVKKDYQRLEQIDLVNLDNKGIEVEFAGKKITISKDENKLYINGEEKISAPFGMYVTNDVIMFYDLGECGFSFDNYLDSNLQIKKVNSFAESEVQLVNIRLVYDRILATTTSCPCAEVACESQGVEITYKNNTVSIEKN